MRTPSRRSLKSLTRRAQLLRRKLNQQTRAARCWPRAQSKVGARGNSTLRSRIIPGAKVVLRLQHSPGGGGQKAARETLSTVGNLHAASQVVKALKYNCSQVGPAGNVNYSRRIDTAGHANVTEEISNAPWDQRDSCCNCWSYSQ
ncbi:uncharacterized protein LOC132385305 isoform X2 [Hypanus sabinus]|uniref:uncharacterized protein LOC132385305 isoform X2 n=1 Tax=Hypanus sabinus TaxID=79690 RepID=UPI0028C4B18B|nr:uncharacterized protein LOC132385305 isoform X2 [Hypanus sabinus]